MHRQGIVSPYFRCPSIYPATRLMSGPLVNSVGCPDGHCGSSAVLLSLVQLEQQFFVHRGVDHSHL